MADAPQGFQLPPGDVVCTTYGQITQETASSLLEARAFCERQGATNIRWRMEPGTLVESTRNNAARTLLRDGGHWLIFVDGDTVFPANERGEVDAIARLLYAAYVETPHADVIGGYVPLRGDLALPTIDTGTGTWESWFPGSGTIPVIRTGCAFLLIKRHAFETLKDPWFRVRVPSRPLDFMLELDGFARQKFDGRNPLRDAPGDAWAKLEKCARDDPSAAPEQFTPIGVGEDSGFCDRVRAAGMQIFVNTDIACVHVDRRILRGADHKKACLERERQARLLVGVMA